VCKLQHSWNLSVRVIRDLIYFQSSYHERTLTYDDENVPGSAAILAAVDESMQAGMPALPGVIFRAVKRVIRLLFSEQIP